MQGITSESMLRGTALPPEGEQTAKGFRALLQKDPETAASFFPLAARRFTTLEDWLFSEKPFLGYRLELLCRRCEIRLLACEAVAALAADTGRKEYPVWDPEAYWDKLLKTQKLSGADRETQDRAEKELLLACTEADKAWAAMAGQMAKPSPEGGWAAVFNLWPVRRTMFTCIRSQGPVSVYRGSRRLPSQYIDGDDATAVELEMDGMSVESLRLEPAGPVSIHEPQDQPYHFENDVMRVDVQPDGRITRLESKANGCRLQAGNLIRGCWRDAAGRNVAFRGEDLPMTARTVRGELFDNLYLKGGRDGIEMEMVLYLPHQSSRRIEIMLDLTLSEEVRRNFLASGGALWAEWHSGMHDPRVLCDRPFGWRACRDGEALSSSNGIAVTQEGSGIIFDHQGVTRAWIREGVLYTLLGKGGEEAAQDAPAGRLDARTPDAPEMRKWRYFYAIDLADEDTPEHLFGRVMSYQFPMLPLRTDSPLEIPCRLQLGEGLIPTAVFRRQGTNFVRGWNAAASERLLYAEGSSGFRDRKLLKPFDLFEKAY